MQTHALFSAERKNSSPSSSRENENKNSIELKEIHPAHVLVTLETKVALPQIRGGDIKEAISQYRRSRSCCARWPEDMNALYSFYRNLTDKTALLSIADLFKLLKALYVRCEKPTKQIVSLKEKMGPIMPAFLKFMDQEDLENLCPTQEDIEVVYRHPDLAKDIVAALKKLTNDSYSFSREVQLAPLFARQWVYDDPAHALVIANAFYNFCSLRSFCDEVITFNEMGALIKANPKKAEAFSSRLRDLDYSIKGFRGNYDGLPEDKAKFIHASLQFFNTFDAVINGLPEVMTQLTLAKLFDYDLLTGMTANFDKAKEIGQAILDLHKHGMYEAEFSQSLYRREHSNQFNVALADFIFNNIRNAKNIVAISLLYKKYDALDHKFLAILSEQAEHLNNDKTLHLLQRLASMQQLTSAIFVSILQSASRVEEIHAVIESSDRLIQGDPSIYSYGRR